MDVQLALLTKIAQEEAISIAVNSKVTADFFTDEHYARIYTFLLGHWRKFGRAPDVNVAQVAFPSTKWDVVEPQPVEYLIEALRQRRKRSLLMQALNDAAIKIQEADAPSAVNDTELLLRDALTKVHLETSDTFDVDFHKAHTEFMDILFDRMDNPGYLRGISTGVKGIDYVTGGLQPEQLVVIIGLPKSLKSSTLLYMALQVHYGDKRPLFVGFEMSNEEQWDRMVSLYTGIALSDIQRGQVDGRTERHIMNVLKRQSERGIPFITSSDLDSAMTVSGIQAKILEYQPDVVFIDAAYLMQSELPKVEQGSASALTDIARSLKRLAQSQRVPIVVSTQASQVRSRGGLNADSAMWTQAWRQSADVLLGVERLDPNADDSKEVEVKFKVLASRSGPRAETILAWDWSHGSCTERDLEEAKRNLAMDDEDG